jgi:hypothetical protein
MRQRDELLEKSASETDDGHLVGKDPRTISPEILSQYYRAKNPVEAIRDKCLDCCCHQAGEVRKCIATDCPLWSFRMGFNPFRARQTLSDEKKRLLSERLRRRRP